MSQFHRLLYKSVDLANSCRKNSGKLFRSSRKLWSASSGWKWLNKSLSYFDLTGKHLSREKSSIPFRISSIRTSWNKHLDIFRKILQMSQNIHSTDYVGLFHRTYRSFLLINAMHFAEILLRNPLHPLHNKLCHRLKFQQFPVGWHFVSKRPNYYLGPIKKYSII